MLIRNFDEFTNGYADLRFHSFFLFLCFLSFFLPLFFPCFKIVCFAFVLRDEWCFESLSLSLSLSLNRTEEKGWIIIREKCIYFNRYFLLCKKTLITLFIIIFKPCMPRIIVSKRHKTLWQVDSRNTLALSRGKARQGKFDRSARDWLGLLFFFIFRAREIFYTCCTIRWLTIRCFHFL